MFDHATLDGLAELVSISLLMLIPIVLILTKHQRKMAEMLHEQAMATQSSVDVESLRRDLDALRADVQQQSVLLNTVVTQQMTLQQSAPQIVQLEKRLSS